jgi:ComF family protein
MHALFEHFLDLLFPPRCVGCKARGALLCGRCRTACQPLPDSTNRLLHRRLGDSSLTSTAGAYRFDGVIREAIHALKYERRTRVAVPLGDLLATYVAAHPFAVDVVVPVPLHAARLQERGFNQSALLAERLAIHLNLPQSTQLVRVRQTEQQASLNRAHRQENVHDAFAWQGTPPPRCVLLIDDVLTTGATIAAAAQAVRAAGAHQVHALALARAGG